MNVPPALEASLGSYYSLSGFVIPHYSKLLNHLLEHVEIVQDFRIEKISAESSENIFLTLTFQTVYCDLYRLFC